MIVQCEQCHQQFDVPDAILRPKGRNLKCTGCGRVFFQAAPVDEVEQAADAVDSDATTLLATSDADHGEDLAEILEGLHGEHPEDEALAMEEEAKWVTDPDDLAEIDIDGDPELRALEELETELTSAPAEDEVESEAETTVATQAGWQQQEETYLEEVEQEILPDEAAEEPATVLESEEALLEEAAEELGTVLESEEALLEEEEAEETALLTEPNAELDTVLEEEEEEEDSVVAEARRQRELALAQEDDPWQEEEIIETSQEKLEPQFDELPGEAAAMAAAGAALLAKGARSDGDEAPVRAAKRSPAKVAVSSTSKLWLAAGILLVLALGALLRTDWWEYTLFNWRSPYRLSALESSWRNHSVGQLLLVQGEVTNHGSTAPPWIRITLLDGKNKSLTSVQIVPGRVVDKRVLDGSGEQAIQAMIRLQGQERTASETSWAGHRLPFQAIFVNPPGEATRFQVDFSTVGATQQKAQL